jgi:uracil-DNA glycosylase
LPKFFIDVRLLTPWADRGVLLLNACLTVRAHNANSHANQGWEQFTSEVLRAVSKSTKGIVFLAWGSPAQKRIDSIGVDKSKHLILRTVHPSPLSAARGFFDCKHFSKTNEWLRNKYGVEGEVEWDCLADDKKRRGLPSREPSSKREADTSPVVKAKVKETAEKDASAKVVEKVVIANGKEVTTVEDAYEFDDEGLAEMLQNE